MRKFGQRRSYALHQRYETSSWCAVRTLVPKTTTYFLQKHKTQLALLKSRNPKRERKLAKRKAALERAAATESVNKAEMVNVGPTNKKKGRSGPKSGTENAMEE